MEINVQLHTVAVLFLVKGASCTHLVAGGWVNTWASLEKLEYNNGDKNMIDDE